MNPIIPNQLKSDWLTKEEELMQKRPRRYLHFDKKIKIISKKIISRITDPKYINKHSFFPLIQRIQTNYLYKKDPATKRKVVTPKERPIAYSSHFDALIYSWYAMQLGYLYENRLKDSIINDSIIAYRKLNKSNVDFAKDVFGFINEKKECASLNLDIRGFYDNLDFNIIKKSWVGNLGTETLPRDHYSVYKSLTKFAYVRIKEVRKLLKIGSEDTKEQRFFLGIDILGKLRSKNKIKTNKIKGIPQGTPISCVVSNLYMYDFDLVVAQKVIGLGGCYRRYSDDIIVVCPRENLEEINTFILEEIVKIKLEIQETKTERRYFKEENGIVVCRNKEGNISKLQYLGIEFNGEKTFLRHKGYAKFERKMTRSTAKEAATAKELKVGIAKRKLYEKYSPFGKANYITYAKSARDKLNSVNISEQVNPNRIMKKLSDKIRKNMNPTVK